MATTDNKQPASMDFDQLLDTNVEVLPEFIGFKQMPPGMYTAFATLSPELSKDGKQFLKLALTVQETLEVAEGAIPPAPNDEFAFTFFTDTDSGIERIGSAFKPFMLAAGIPNLRELLNQLVGANVAVKVGSYTAKPDANGVSKTYATLDELLPA